MSGLDFTLIFVAVPEKHSQHGFIPYGEVLCVYSTCTCKFDDLLPNNLIESSFVHFPCITIDT